MGFAGLTLEEREAMRGRYLDAVTAQAGKQGLTARCKRVWDKLDDSAHRLCRGEEPGGAGCLCRCHDFPKSCDHAEPEAGRGRFRA